MGDGIENVKNYGPEVFDNRPSTKYLKVTPGEEVVVGVKSVAYTMTTFPSDPTPKPAMVLSIDNLNGQSLPKPMEFTITGKYFANTVREYEKSTDVNLFKWLFRIKRNGSGMETRYVFTPHAKRTNGGGSV